MKKSEIESIKERESKMTLELIFKAGWRGGSCSYVDGPFKASMSFFFSPPPPCLCSLHPIYKMKEAFFPNKKVGCFFILAHTMPFLSQLHAIVFTSHSYYKLLAIELKLLYYF